MLFMYGVYSALGYCMVLCCIGLRTGWLNAGLCYLIIWCSRFILCRVYTVYGVYCYCMVLCCIVQLGSGWTNNGACANLVLWLHVVVFIMVHVVNSAVWCCVVYG